MLHRALQIETLKSVHKNGVQYTSYELKQSFILKFELEKINEVVL